jgi:hypothetical protein
LHVAAAALAYFIAYLVLKIRTDRNHDNLTNEEMDWKQELGKKEATDKSVEFYLLYSNKNVGFYGSLTWFSKDLFQPCFRTKEARTVV